MLVFYYFRIFVIHCFFPTNNCYAMCNRKFLSNPFTVWNSMACRRDAQNFAKNILVPSMHRSLSSHAWHYGSRLGYFRSLSSDWYWSHKCLDIDIFACQLDCDENPNKMKLTKVCLKVRASVVIDEFLTKMYFIFKRDAETGYLDRPGSGLARISKSIKVEATQ